MLLVLLSYQLITADNLMAAQRNACDRKSAVKHFQVCCGSWRFSWDRWGLATPLRRLPGQDRARAGNTGMVIRGRNTKVSMATAIMAGRRSPLGRVRQVLSEPITARIVRVCRPDWQNGEGIFLPVSKSTSSAMARCLRACRSD